MSEHLLQHDSHKRVPQQQQHEEATPQAAPRNDLTRMQQQLGNQAMQRLLATGSLSTTGGVRIQAKLTVTPGNDQYEQEADHAADQVMRQIQAPAIQREGEEEEMLQGKRVDVVQREGEEEEMLQGKRVDVVQREGEEEEMLQGKRVDVVQREGEEEEMLQGKRVDVVQREGDEEEMLQGKRVDVVQREGEEEEMMAKRVDVVQREGDEEEMMAKRVDVVQRAGGMDGFEVDGEVEQGIHSAKGGGESLPSAVQDKMGSAFGADFSNVRVHNDSQADSLNKSVQAKAFTHGSDIFFRQGEYSPGSEQGQHLLAHELTHTIQQGAVNTKRDSE